MSSTPTATKTAPTPVKHTAPAAPAAAVVSKPAAAMKPAAAAGVSATTTAAAPPVKAPAPAKPAANAAVAPASAQPSTKATTNPVAHSPSPAAAAAAAVAKKQHARLAEDEGVAEAGASVHTGIPPSKKTKDASIAPTRTEESKDGDVPAASETAAAVAAATSSPAATSLVPTPSAASGTALTTVKAKTEKQLRAEAVKRQVEHCLHIIQTKFPTANCPPCLWPLLTQKVLKERRKQKNYFANIKVNSVSNKVSPGDIDFIITESNLNGTSSGDIGMRMVNVKLRRGDQGFDKQYLTVAGPPMVLSHVTPPLGTFQSPNTALTGFVENKEFPDQHTHIHGLKSNAYLLPENSKSELTDPEVERFERWLLGLQASYMMALIESEELRRSEKPKMKKGDVKDQDWYKTVIQAFEKIFRLIKFDDFTRNQKAAEKGVAKTELAVKDIATRKIDDNVMAIDIDRLFGLNDDDAANSYMRTDGDEGDEGEEEEEEEETKEETKKDAGLTDEERAGKKLDRQVRAYAESDGGVELTPEEVAEYARIAKVNEDCLGALCNIVYCALVDALDGYDKSKDLFRSKMTLPERIVRRRVPLRQFAHPDAPLLPQSEWPLITDTVEPFIASGHTSVRSNVFSYQKKRVTDANWRKTVDKKYARSTDAQSIPFFDILFKTRRIVPKYIPHYVGLSDMPVKWTEQYYQSGDVVMQDYAIKCTLNGTVKLDKSTKDVANLKMELASSRLLFRPPTALCARILHSTGGALGTLKLSEDAFTANVSSPTTAMTITEDGAEITKSWSEETRNLMSLLATPDAELCFPLLPEMNASFQDKALAGLMRMSEDETVAFLIQLDGQFKANAAQKNNNTQDGGGNHIADNMSRANNNNNNNAYAAAAAAASSSSNNHQRPMLKQATAAPDFGGGGAFVEHDDDAYTESVMSHSVD